MVSYIRFGDRVYAAMPSTGMARVILSFEPLEALRNTPLIARGGWVLVNDRPLPPVQVSMGMYAYPDYRNLAREVEETLEARFVWVNGEALAHRAGDPITVNTVMLGVLSRVPGFPLSRGSLLASIEENTPPRLLEANRRAFELGEAEASRLLSHVPREAHNTGG